MKWDIPGGTVEPGETMEDAIIREVKEETSINIKIKNVLYIYTNFDNYPNRQTFQIIYLSDYLNGEVILNSKEHDSYKWVDYKEIYKLDTIEFLKSFIKSAIYNENILFQHKL